MLCCGLNVDRLCSFLCFPMMLRMHALVSIQKTRTGFNAHMSSNVWWGLNLNNACHLIFFLVFRTHVIVSFRLWARSLLFCLMFTLKFHSFVNDWLALFKILEICNNEPVQKVMLDSHAKARLLYSSIPPSRWLVRSWRTP